MEFNHGHGHGHANLLLPVSFNPYGDGSSSMMSLVTGDHDGHMMSTMVQPNYHIPLSTSTTEQQHHHHNNHNQPYLHAVALFEEQRMNPLNHYGDSTVISSYDCKPQISAKFGGDFRNPLDCNNNPQPPPRPTTSSPLGNNMTNVYNNHNYSTSHNTTTTTTIDSNRNNDGSSRKHGNINELEDEEASLRAKIRSHPRYQQLITAYVKCQKVGAPFEVVAKLDELGKEHESLDSTPNRSPHGIDPELDQFMEDYCSLLQKLHEELAAPFKEAMGFFRKMEQQLNGLSVHKGAFKLSHPGDEKLDLHASSEEEDGSYGEIEAHDVDPFAEDTKIKEQLLRKYRAYIGTLKKEFLKKKKKGKLPKEARQRLLDWWSRHYRWPYPSESEKASLAHSTGLDQKQINNWFINQRKRHWKPSEDNIHYAMAGSSPNNNNIHDFPDGTSNIGGSLETTLLPTNR